MKQIFLGLTLASLMVVTPDVSYAQSADEIVVTGTRISRASDFENGGPGVTLIKRGDFLLLEVLIESDARERTDRMAEILQTIEAMISAAENDPSIELSIIESGRTVQKLTTSNYLGGVSSIARLRVKTAIPEQVENSARLASKLSRFVDTIEETGRITISTAGETSVSVLDPFQYRDDVVSLIITEVNAVTDALGPEYVAIIEGLDRQVYWDRKGDIDLAFSLPYTYKIIIKLFQIRCTLSRRMNMRIKD